MEEGQCITKHIHAPTCTCIITMYLSVVHIREIEIINYNL